MLNITCRWAERFWNCWMPARQRSSPLWRSSDLVAELRYRNSVTTGPKKTVCAQGTRHNRAQSCTSGEHPLKHSLSGQLNASVAPGHFLCLSLTAASSTSTQTRASATAPSSTLVSTWTLASTSTTRSTALQRPRGTCWGLRLGPRSWDSTRGMQTVTWANCFPLRWGKEREMMS